MIRANRLRIFLVMLWGLGYFHCQLASAQQFNSSNGTTYGSTDSAFKAEWDSTNDALIFKAAPSGTAGATITWTDGLTLSSAGRVLLQVDDDTGTCTTAKTGRLRYSSTSLAVCNGSAWTPFRPTGGPPGAGYFVPTRGQYNGCLGPIVGSITRSGTTATVTISTFGSSTHGLSTGQSVTVTGATPSQYNGTFTITVPNNSTFTYTMSSDPGSSNTTVSATRICPDSGGLTLANEICLKSLTTYTSWFGYTQANAEGRLDSTHVKAFLCDGITCNNMTPNTNYYFGNPIDSNAGGGFFTTDASGYGPDNSHNWQYANLFGVLHWMYQPSRYYWTGRGTTSATKWSGTSDANNCSGWTNGSSGSGALGLNESTNAGRWNNGTLVCSQNSAPYAPGLLCMVNP